MSVPQDQRAMVRHSLGSTTSSRWETIGLEKDDL